MVELKNLNENALRDYRAYEERTVDEQYKNLIRQILENGIKGPGTMVDKEGKLIDTIDLMGANTIRFNIYENGAPIITERSIGFWQSAVGELFGFINGVHTQAELEKFCCKWWKAWCTDTKCAKRGLETGDLGPGSYGAAFTNFPTIDGKYFNQFDNIVKQMKERPELKAHFISPWIPQYTIRNSDYQQKVVVVPCHGWIHFRIFGDFLSLVMFQRSCDVLIGLPSNWAQYSALLIAMAKVLDLVPYEFVHQISDAHLFENQMPWVEEILSRDTHPFPTLKLVNEHKDIKDYRPDDFKLEDYHPEKAIKDIPVGV